MHRLRTVAVRRMDRRRARSDDSQLRRERPFASELLRAARLWRWRCRWTLPLHVAGTDRLTSRCRTSRAAWSSAPCSVGPRRSRLLDARRRPARDARVRGQALPVPAGPCGAVGAVRDVDRAARRRAGAGDGVGSRAAWGCGASAVRPRAPAQRAAVARRPRGRRPGRARARARRRRALVADADRAAAPRRRRPRPSSRSPSVALDGGDRASELVADGCVARHPSGRSGPAAAFRPRRRGLVSRLGDDCSRTRPGDGPRSRRRSPPAEI